MRKLRSLVEKPRGSEYIDRPDQSGYSRSSDQPQDTILQHPQQRLPDLYYGPTGHNSPESERMCQV